MQADTHQHGPGKRGLLIALAFPLVAIAIVTGLEGLASDVPGNQAVAASLPDPGFGPSSYADALAKITRATKLGRERVAKGEDQWLRRESLARALHRRSQLTGDFGDLIQATRQVDLGLDLAPKGSGPLLTWATISMSSHRIHDAEKALSGLGNLAVDPVPAEQSEIAALKGDVAFFQGSMTNASRAYKASLRLDQGVGVAMRLARLAKATGDLQSADIWLAKSLESETSASPQLVASVEMQLGSVDLARGDYPAAKAHFKRADRIFRGYWLTQAHLAQAKAVKGDLPAAIADLTDIAKKRRIPDVMDALALYLRANGQLAESRLWAQRSRLIWQDRLEALPEAAIGHALEHELAFGSPDRAVELAKRNLSIRPNGEARLLLAQAYQQLGHYSKANDQLSKAIASGWRSAPLYALQSETLTLLGQLEDAAKARDKAKDLNPLIFDPATALIWFSHG